MADNPSFLSALADTPTQDSHSISGPLAHTLLIQRQLRVKDVLFEAYENSMSFRGVCSIFALPLSPDGRPVGFKIVADMIRGSLKFLPVPQKVIDYLESIGLAATLSQYGSGNDEWVKHSILKNLEARGLLPKS